MPLRPPSTAANGRLEARKRAFKEGINVHDSRRRLEDDLVAIRKNNREDCLARKRHGAFSHFRQQLQPEPAEAPPCPTNNMELYNLPMMLQGVSSENSQTQLEATTQFMKLLSFSQKPPIKEVIEAGVVPRFVEFLSRYDLPQLQFEAAWVLTNITSGTSEHTKAVIDSGAVPKFVQLLSSPNDDVREQAAWALGNIAGDSPCCRDVVLRNGALLPLLAQLNEQSKLSMLRIATWALTSFCSGKPSASFEVVKPALQILQQLIFSSDQEILTNVCWALSYICLVGIDRIQTVLEGNIFPRLIELLRYPLPAVLLPVIKIIGYIVAKDDALTQVLIGLGVLPCLLELLKQGYKVSIKKAVCWVISNITDRNEAQIQAIIDANIIGSLVQLLQHAEFDVKKEAVWAISNAIHRGSAEQILHMVNQGCIKPLCDLLVCPEPMVVTLCLGVLERALGVGKVEKDLGRTCVNLPRQFIEECEGVEKIENLKGHNITIIYEMAINLMATYWIEEEES